MEQFNQPIIDRWGNALPNIPVLVKKEDGTPATLYTASGGTVIPNPTKSDTLGRISFAAANGKYTLITQSPIVQPDVEYAFTLFDPADGTSNFLSSSEYPTMAAFVTAAAGKRAMIGAGEAAILNVPTEFPTISAALAATVQWIIAGTGTVTIKVADGTHALGSSTVMNHPFGAQIRVVGNEVSPANCVLQASGPGFDGIVVSNGNVLGYINGFKIVKAVKALFADNSTALLAVAGGKIICGPTMAVDNWYYGIAAREGSYIYAPFAQVDHAGDVGIWAFVGSTIDCPNAVSNNASDVANGWGYGIQAEYGSTINCSNGSATGCLVGGIASLSNSNVRALAATASGNVGSGFFARDDGTIECHNGIANNNGRYGVEEIGASRIIGNSIMMSGNTLASVKPTAYFDNGSLGPRVVSAGDFRIDVVGNNSWFFNSSGGLQFSISDTPNAVNRLNVTGSAAGQPVTLRPLGESVADIAVTGTGAGSYVRLGGAVVGGADAPIVGHWPIKTLGGTIVKLAVIA